MRRTKIVCTIGPASSSYELIESLIKKGMDVARLNFSHGSYEEHSLVAEYIHQASSKLGKPVAILQDLGGPKIRTGLIQKEPVILKEGSIFTLTTRNIPGNEKEVSITYPSLPQKVKKGQTILLADGSLELRVEDITSTDIKCRVVTGGQLTSHKGINLPDSSPEISALTEKDQKDLLFGIEHKFDFIGISFVREAEDILRVRKILKEKRAEEISLIAKIEKREALKNIDDIIRVADGIMVARGDLGVEIPLQQVPLVQKEIIKKCNLLGKPVITATQMLESMIENPRPTRAEVTDIANAIFDGTDAIMLSEETAIGNYPLEAVTIMDKIAVETEKALDYEKTLEERALSVKPTIPDAISHATCQVAQDLKVAAIVTFTFSGSTARMVARYRPRVPIIARSPKKSTVRKLTLSWGVYPLQSPEIKDTDDMIRKAKRTALKTGLVKRGDKIVITAGIPFGIAGTTNLIKVETVD
ncbi:MAG TPA: pyruvate kinase [Candidatus Aerophobetes bacterium]|uniref:Pyruvate kinase n=1 Tax=Aerophobetes bacterium TaxID=2030807 RepID=A0A662DJM3_UNCAE|nr:MAG: pyruvate kinase [Candidatus Aerophobetes bacterium]HDN84795.1 pyruvate kinase [Candidatus Aerophobetes bacterium]